MSRQQSSPPQTTARLDDGVRVACEQGRAGDVIEAYAGDDLLGSAKLRRGKDGRFSAHIALRDIPDLAFPARLRLLHVRAGTEIAPLVLADADALLAGSGPPGLTGAFAGLHPTGPAFAIDVDRLARYPRDFVLHVAGQVASTARSVPGAPHVVVFPLPAPIAPGTPYRVTDSVFGATAAEGVFDAPMMLAALAAQTARLQGEVTQLRDDNAALCRRLDTARDLGRESLLLDRLDLFYLLLNERLDRADAPRPATHDAVPVLSFTPAEIDGIGIFDIETDGGRQWRWFGPDCTLALRGLPGPPRRVVLYFHGFAGDGDPPEARISCGGPPRPARWRAMEGRHALDLPLSAAALLGGDMLVLHLTFDRHVATPTDPRSLSAVFTGAEVLLGAA